MARWVARIGRFLGYAALAAALAFCVAACVWRSYEPRLRIDGLERVPLAFSPNGQVLVVGKPVGLIGYAEGPLEFLSTVDGGHALPALSTAENPQTRPGINHIQYSPDGKLLAVLQDHNYTDVELVLFDVAKQERVATQLIPYPVTFSNAARVDVRFSADSSLLLWCVELPARATRSSLGTWRRTRSGSSWTRRVSGGCHPTRSCWPRSTTCR